MLKWYSPTTGLDVALYLARDIVWVADMSGLSGRSLNVIAQFSKLWLEIRGKGVYGQEVKSRFFLLLTAIC